MQPRSWSRACKRVAWARLLSGLTLEPSTAGRGVESWIASRRVIRASHSVSRDHVAALRILAICGRTSRASSAKSNPQLSFLRMSPAIYPSDSMKSPAIYTEWVIGLRREYSRRLKLGHPIDASDCLSWPTPDTNTATYSNGHNGFVNIRKAATWATPSSHDGRRPGSDATSTQGRNLKRETEAWPTPRTNKWGPPDSHGRPPQMPTGPESIESCGPRSLNPNFVEWLMGMPHGWTDFAPLAMPFSHWWRLMRSELSRLN